MPSDLLTHYYAIDIPKAQLVEDEAIQREVHSPHVHQHSTSLIEHELKVPGWCGRGNAIREIGPGEGHSGIIYDTDILIFISTRLWYWYIFFLPLTQWKSPHSGYFSK